MIKEISFKIDELNTMKNYPNNLYYLGNLELLKREKVSIIGTRRPSSYSKNLVFELSSKLSKLGIVIVSGGAIGIDAVAHKAAGEDNTILVSPTSLDNVYPKFNKDLIEKIQSLGLALSMVKENYFVSKKDFVFRNELIVALGKILIIAQADLNSGSMRSAQYAIAQNKDIYVFPHRMGESMGINFLLKNKLAKLIYDIDEFIENIFDSKKTLEVVDEFLEFCKTYPSYEEAINKFSNKVIEYELEGKIIIENSIIKPNFK